MSTSAALQRHSEEPAQADDAAISHGVDDGGDDAPDFKAVLFVGLERLVLVVVRRQTEFALDFFQPLNRQFALHHRNHDPVLDRPQGAVNHQDIARMNPRPEHRVPLGSYEKGGGGVLDQELVEVELGLDIVVGRRGKPGADGLGEKGRFAFLGVVVGGQIGRPRRHRRDPPHRRFDYFIRGNVVPWCLFVHFHFTYRSLSKP